MIELRAPEKKIKPDIQLSGSKSMSNRLLILKHVLQLDIELLNLSDSEDTQLLQKALSTISASKEATIDVNHAGTDMRFLTALLSISEDEWTISGSQRIKQRPIAELVNALRSLGADIQYLENENYPPLKISGKKLTGGTVEINSEISSQFISALLLIAPRFENGLCLRLLGRAVSSPYIEMTINTLQHFGIKVEKQQKLICVQPYTKSNQSSSSFFIESDWSSASYWYSICALNKESHIQLEFLNEKSSQADSILPQLYRQLGVKTESNEKGLHISHTGTYTKKFEYDFTNCPDIAMTLAVTCFALGIEARLSGLQTLKIKESNRLAVLKTELEKLGAKPEISDTTFYLPVNHIPNLQPFTLETYNDHRVAMSFAPLVSLCKSLLIKDAEVVDKSYPAFWEHLKKAGFSVTLTP